MFFYSFRNPATATNNPAGALASKAGEKTFTLLPPMIFENTQQSRAVMSVLDITIWG